MRLGDAVPVECHQGLEEAAWCDAGFDRYWRSSGQLARRRFQAICTGLADHGGKHLLGFHVGDGAKVGEEHGGRDGGRVFGPLEHAQDLRRAP
jgi:hypothetical protein